MPQKAKTCVFYGPDRGLNRKASAKRRVPSEDALNAQAPHQCCISQRPESPNCAGKIIHLERIAADIASNIAQAQRDLEAIDRIIKIFDDRIDPTAIKPITAVKKIPRGPRGGLTLALKAVLETAGAEGLLLRKIMWALQLKYGLTFETPKEFNRFVRNTLRHRLYELVQSGILQAVPEEHPDAIGNQPFNRYWLASLAPSSLDSLVARAEAHGMTVREVDGETASES